MSGRSVKGKGSRKEKGEGKGGERGKLDRILFRGRVFKLDRLVKSSPVLLTDSMALGLAEGVIKMKKKRWF